MLNRPTLEELRILAHQAGKILKDGYGNSHEVVFKGVTDLVTEVDRRSEDMLVGYIQDNYPRHAIIAEEQGYVKGDDNARWLIDPLDGTINYAHNLPFFCVSIAYQENGDLRLGVVYDPMRDECFSAERGKGAWLNGLPIRVSTTAALIHCILGTNFPYDVTNPATDNMPPYTSFIQKTQSIRRLGSAALDMAYVAVGRLDGYWESQLCSWDVAAAALIVLEAGGVVTDLKGGQGYMQPPYAVAAANPAIHRQMMDVLNRV
jgi:myo-inositol-1(or 4)-monophosphatase